MKQKKKIRRNSKKHCKPLRLGGVYKEVFTWTYTKKSRTLRKREVEKYWWGFKSFAEKKQSHNPKTRSGNATKQKLAAKKSKIKLRANIYIHQLCAMHSGCRFVAHYTWFKVVMKDLLMDVQVDWPDRY